MSDDRFADLLERTMGLKAASIGASAVERVVSARIAASKSEGGEAYWELLQHSPDELQELIEAVVVPETWFFRDPQAFMAMASIAKQGWPGDASRPLRLLSLPCSTGEEPYTMAMALLDAGLPASRFKIDAIDISTRSLTKARCGVYGRNSFRGQDLGFRDRYLESAEGRHAIRDIVREPVHFAQGNMLDPDFLSSSEGYDILFCRNLLIYFDAPTQIQAIAVLKRLLSPEGTLFVGHSEAGLLPAHGFASAKLPMTFAFRRAAAAENRSKVKSALPPPAPVRRRPAFTRPAPARLVEHKCEATPSAPQQGIEQLRQIADRGDLDEAARACGVHMRECGPSPEALLLLALISDAAGDPSAAATYYRKALYLEPTNSEALGHLALLLRKQGDHAGVKLLNDRMRRQNERRVG